MEVMTVKYMFLLFTCFCPVFPKGTTPNILDILLGRCFEYKNILDVNRNSTYDCHELTGDFVKSFIYKNPCELTQASYSYFMRLATQTIPENKAIFWSGTYMIAHEYAGSGERFMTLEDTLIGHLANGLTWCGQTEEPGIDYSQCPSYSSCPEDANKSFWGAASKTFASHTSGVVTLLLNGSNPNVPAYRTDSFFAEFELPALSVDKVTRINVLVVHDLDSQTREMCGSDSLQVLTKAIEDKGILWECVDDPKTIIYLLCVDDPYSRECRLVGLKMKQ